MNMIARNVLLLTALSSTWACSSESAPVDIGDSRTGAKLEDYAAVWEGYVEAYDFADGSDKVKITLDASGNGTLEIGDTARWPVATNPDVGYPPGPGMSDRFENALVAGVFAQAVSKLFPGIIYPVSSATVEAARIRFSVNPWESERDWCALQTSYPVQKPSAPYGCLPTANISNPSVGECFYSQNDGSGVTPVDCGKAAMCHSNAVCTCDAQGCSILSDPMYRASYTKLDAALVDAGESLVGTLRLGPDPVQKSINVRLTRISND